MITIAGDTHTVRGVKAGQYIRRIRNKTKRNYARGYPSSRIGGKETERGPLSYMAAQAVRAQLDFIITDNNFEVSKSNLSLCPVSRHYR